MAAVEAAMLQLEEQDIKEERQLTPMKIPDWDARKQHIEQTTKQEETNTEMEDFHKVCNKLQSQENQILFALQAQAGQEGLKCASALATNWMKYWTRQVGGPTRPQREIERERERDRERENHRMVPKGSRY